MKLDLSLKQLPSNFFQQHKDLEELSLIGCSNLNNLLPEIGLLQSLQKLTISGGDIKALPPEIGQFNWFPGSSWEPMPRGSASRGSMRIRGRASGSALPGRA